MKIEDLMKLRTFLIIVSLMTSVLFAYEPHFMEDPAISPDGDLISFVYDDDLWTVPFDGGSKKINIDSFQRIFPYIFTRWKMDCLRQ